MTAEEFHYIALHVKLIGNVNTWRGVILVLNTMTRLVKANSREESSVVALD